MKKIKRKHLLTTFLLVFALLILLSPPVGDDFNRLTSMDLGLSQVMSDLAEAYKKLNGRVIGNGLSFFFIKNPFRTIFKLTNFTGLAVLIRKIFKERISYSTLALALMVLPMRIFREVVGWSAGFFNYVPVLVLIFLTLYLVEEEGLTRPGQVLVFISSLISCLFMENLSLYALILGPLAMLVLGKGKKSSYLAAFLGAGLGNLIMFSSPVYRRISKGEDTYRKLGSASLMDKVGDNWQVFQEDLLPLVVALAFALVLIMLLVKNKNRRALVPLIFLGLLGLVKNMDFSFILSILVHLGFYLGLLNLYRDRGYYGRLGIFAVLSMALVMGPLLIVSPVGHRNFFTSHVFNYMVLASLVLSHGLIIRPRIQNLLLVLAIVKALVLFVPTTVNYVDYKRIMEKVEEATIKGEDQVKLEYYTFPSTIHREDGSKISNYFMEKYKKDKPVKVVFE